MATKIIDFVKYQQTKEQKKKDELRKQVIARILRSAAKLKW